MNPFKWLIRQIISRAKPQRPLYSYLTSKVIILNKPIEWIEVKFTMDTKEETSVPTETE